MPDGAHSRQVDPEVKYSGWHPPTAELAHQKSKEHGESQRGHGQVAGAIRCN